MDILPQLPKQQSDFLSWVGTDWRSRQWGFKRGQTWGYVSAISKWVRNAYSLAGVMDWTQ